MDSKIIKGQSSDKVAAGIAADPEFEKIQDLLRDTDAIDSAMSEIDSFAMSLDHIDKLEAGSDDDSLFGESLGLPAASTATGAVAAATVDDASPEMEARAAEAGDTGLSLSPLEDEDGDEDADAPHAEADELEAVAKSEGEADRSIEDLLQEAAAAQQEEISDDDVERLLGADDAPAHEEGEGHAESEDVVLSPKGHLDDAEDAPGETEITFPDGEIEELDATAIMRNAVASGMAIAKPADADDPIAAGGDAIEDDIEGEAESWEAISDDGADAASAAAVDYRRALSSDADEPADLDEIDDAIEPPGLHLDDETNDEAEIEDAPVPLDAWPGEATTAADASWPGIEDPAAEIEDAKKTLIDAPDVEPEAGMETETMTDENMSDSEAFPGVDETGAPEATGDSDDAAARKKANRKFMAVLLATAAVIVGAVGFSFMQASGPGGAPVASAPAPVALVAADDDEDEGADDLAGLRSLAAFAVPAPPEDEDEPVIAGIGTATPDDVDFSDLFLGTEDPAEEIVAEVEVEIEPTVALSDFEALMESVKTLDANNQDLFEVVEAQAERIAHLEATLNAVAERADRAESLALGQNQVLVRFVAAEEKLEIAEQLIVDLSRRVATVEGIDPADREDMDTRLADLDQRMHGLQRDVGMVARLTMNGSPAAMGGRAPSGQTNFDRANGAQLASPVARPENVPNDVAVGDFVNGYGAVLEIFATSDGGRMVVMENGSVILN